MKVEHLKRLPIMFIGVFLVLSSSAPVFALKPYFKSYGSDVMTGGWFENGGTCDTSTYYQEPGFGATADKRTGGILAFAKDKGNSGKADGGASSQYAAYSLGIIDSDYKNDFGFYTDGANIGGSTRADDLAFANKNPDLPASAWGGLFEGSVKQSHCIPDYYGAMPAGLPATGSGNTLNDLVSTASAGNYYDFKIAAPAGANYDLTRADVSLPAGTRINIYVDGNVYIGNNIFYAASTADTVPKLRIVAKGNIFIGPGVNNIDGWYIAQPDMTETAAEILGDKSGVIWTCHGDDQAAQPDSFLIGNCVRKLIINGALTAKQYNLTRLMGDVNLSSINEDALATPGGGINSPHIAEVINYTPAMVIGGGFSNPVSGGGPLPIDSLISLPPLF